MLPIIITRRIDSANARNWPGLVVMHPDCPLPAAVLAQEAVEAIAKLNPVTLTRTRLSAPYRRQMEVWSHEHEVQAAALIYGRDVARYRAAEAERMVAGYDGLFAGISPEWVAYRMASHSDEANRWVRRNRNWLERWK